MIMRLAIFILLSFAIMVAATEEYQVQIVRASASSNMLENCKETTLNVDFQKLTLKSGVTYERRPVAKTWVDSIASTAVVLGVDPHLFSCSKEAGKTGHNSFIIRQGKCLASNISVPEYCGCANEEVVYAASELLSPDAGLPVSKISNLRVSMDIELGKIKVTVVFDEGSLSPDLYSYQLEFDDRSEVVTSGSEIILGESAICIDLVFTLTPYICNRKKWGNSAVYQLQREDIPPPGFDTEAVAFINEPWKLTLNNLTRRLVKDPCHTVVGYTIKLHDSAVGDANQTLEFSLDETEIVLTCEQTGSFKKLELNVKTVEGVRTPEGFMINPLDLGTAKKVFDTKIYQVCWLSVPKVFRNSAEAVCKSHGGRQIGRDQIQGSYRPELEFHTWIPLDFNTSVGMWQWDDGTFMANDDPLWEAPPSFPLYEYEKPYMILAYGIMIIGDSRYEGKVVCYLDKVQ